MKEENNKLKLEIESSSDLTAVVISFLFSDASGTVGFSFLRVHT